MLTQYLDLFALGGMKESEVREHAEAALQTVRSWDRRYAEEIEGIASAAELDPWKITALNARTELLMSQEQGVTFGGECSTLAFADEHRVLGIQTWDWQDELSAYWHTQTVFGGRLSHRGVSEHGILAKIGMNSAGVGVFLNILSSVDDHTSGVPIHVLIASVLDNAASVFDAIDLLQSAPLASSSNLTVIDSHTACAVELSPNGVRVVPADEHDVVVHTNHYLSAELQGGERRGRFGDDSYERQDLLCQRTRSWRRPTTIDDLPSFLHSDPGEPKLSCRADPGASFGQRVRTLATVRMDPRASRIDVLDGSPAESEHDWVTLAETE
ncbi:penicillin acyltransferase [Microbacterium sp. C5A9]|nr:penicillin acyltransferase [Microbacterium sp. C5A9]